MNIYGRYGTLMRLLWDQTAQRPWFTLFDRVECESSDFSGMGENFQDYS